jgi:hypothetical protein
MVVLGRVCAPVAMRITRLKSELRNAMSSDHFERAMEVLYSKEDIVAVCITDECENLTKLVLCDDCTDEQFASYESQKER